MDKLAINGGPTAMTEMTGKPQPKIGVEEFLSIAERFSFTPDAIARIRAAVSDDDFLGGGPYLARYYSNFPGGTMGDRFENAAKEKFGSKYALAVSSGTAALHAAFVAVGVGPGKEVICPAIGFMATAAAVAHAGGTPVFCDVDTSIGIDPTKIEALITERTVAIAPTHCMGSIADVGAVVEIARRHGLAVIEDCAQAPGGHYRGKYVGTTGDIGCFSISAYKIIGGGEAGMVITNNERYYERACQLAECGGLWRPDRFGPERYEGELFAGTNYRLSEMESAINVVQMRKLDGVVSRNHNVKMRVLGQLKTYREITPQKLNDPEGEVGYLLRFFPENPELSAKIATALKAEGIGCGTRGADSALDWHIYCDMLPLTKTSSAAHCDRGSCPVAESIWAREVLVNLNQWYSPEDCDAIANGINKVLSAYCTEDPAATKWV